MIMKSQPFKTYIFLIILTFVLGGCYSPGQQNKADITDEKSGLQRYEEMVTSNNPDKSKYETTKPAGYVRFSWVPQQSPELNFAEGKDYQLYALVDPKDYKLDDFSATQIFYFELVKDNNHTYFGPFETKHLDFTQ